MSKHSLYEVIQLHRLRADSVEPDQDLLRQVTPRHTRRVGAAACRFPARDIAHINRHRCDDHITMGSAANRALASLSLPTNTKTIEMILRANAVEWCLFDGKE